MNRFTYLILILFSITLARAESAEVKCKGRETVIKREFEVVEDDSVRFSPVKFYLYTKHNNMVPQEIIIGNDSNLLRSHFSKERPTKITIHGWRGSSTDGFSCGTKDAFLSKYDVNVIVVDWAADAALEYDQVCVIVPQVGKQVSMLIDWLLDIGADTNSFHIMGFSVGAHAAGSAGRHVTRAKMPYVTGLDPAKYHWQQSPASLSRSDAAYVEVIHTSTGCFGITRPMGHNDFYPNGGEIQPGCAGDGTAMLICAHLRASRLFIESIVSDEAFSAVWCASYEHMQQGKCSPNEGRLYMGGIAVKPPKGVFYLETNDATPFSKEAPVEELR